MHVPSNWARRLTLLSVTVVSLAIAACSGGSDDPPAIAPTNEPPATTTPITTDSFAPTPTPINRLFVPGPSASPTRPPAVEPYPTRTPTPTPPPPMQVTWLTGDDVPKPLSGTVYEELLGRLPDNENTRAHAILSDHAGVMEFMGMEIPDATQPNELVFDLLTDMVRTADETGFAPEFPAWPRTARDYISVYDRYEYVGFEHWSVWQTANAGEPPNTYDFAFGDFDPGRTTEKLASCECAQPEIRQYSGVDYYAWGPEFIGEIQKRHDPPLYDHVGRGPRVLVRPGEGFYSVSNQVMADFIDVSEGSLSSLAAAGEYIQAARALAGLGLMRDMTFKGSGLAAADARDFSSSNQPLFQEIVRTVDLLQPFDLAASGVGFDGESAFTGLVIVNPDAATAELNAERLLDRVRSVPATTRSDKTLADGLIKFEIGVDGNLVLARLYFREPQRNLFGFPLWNANTLVLHDGPGTGDPDLMPVLPVTRTP